MALIWMGGSRCGGTKGEQAGEITRPQSATRVAWFVGPDRLPSAVETLKRFPHLLVISALEFVSYSTLTVGLYFVPSLLSSGDTRRMLDGQSYADG